MIAHEIFFSILCVCIVTPSQQRVADMLAGTQTQKRLRLVYLEEQLHLLQCTLEEVKWQCRLGLLREVQPSFLQLMPSVKMGLDFVPTFTQHTLP
jgi:hypothetical protein